MEPQAEPETVSLFALWKPHRDEARPFGEVCTMARNGEIPGTVPTPKGTPSILKSMSGSALAAMRRPS